MKFILKFTLALLCALTVACGDTKDEPKPEPEQPEQPEKPETPAAEIKITALDNVSVARRGDVTVAVTVSGNVDPLPLWECTVSDPAVVLATRISEKALGLHGVGAGTADVKIACRVDDKEFAHTIHVTVDAGTVRILAIGNSFSQDAVEQYLYELADAAGFKTVIGNCYIGGCDLDKHLSNMQSDAAAYEYRKVVDGKKDNRKGVRLSEALADEPWDYISLQQASGKSGMYETYNALGQLIDGVSAAVPEAMLMWHQTWAYAAGSNHESFPNYGSDQTTMYKAIVAAARRAVSDHSSLVKLIPSGTAIQNARGTYVGDIFNRDGYHLEVTYGRYTAACTWFETIFGTDVTANPYAPSTVTDEMGRIARAAAHAAVASPDAVSVLKEFQTPDIVEGPLKNPVYIDFGPNAPSASPWNNVTSYKSAATPTWLKDAEGNFVSANIRVIDGFTANYPGVSGENKHTEFTAAGYEFPVSAWKDGLMVGGTKGEGDTAPAHIEIGGLDAARTYHVTLLGVRFNGSRDARISAYRVKGSVESEVKQVKTGLKIGSGAFADFSKVPFDEFTAVFSSQSPAADGTLTIEVTGIDTGAAAEGHINAIVLAPAD